LATLIDTSVLIEIERRRMRFSETHFSQSDLASISAVTVSELLIGLHSAQTEEQRSHRQSFYDDLLESVQVLPFDLAAAEVHSRIWFQMRSTGTTIGVNDTLIAATAIAYQCSLLTNNVREFSRVPCLDVIQSSW
jgi:predicted nucleic acid-binding protein